MVRVWLIGGSALLALGYVALCAWYALGVETWRQHVLYPPPTWGHPPGDILARDTRGLPGELWRFYR